MVRQGHYLKEHRDSTWAILADNVEKPFNELILVSVEQGIIGLLLVISVVFLIFTPCLGTLFHSIFITLILFACFSYLFNL
jgi:hypothetical protein